VLTTLNLVLSLLTFKS